MRHWRSLFSRRLIACLALVCLTLLTTAGDWPTYLHDTGHSGASGDETILSPANVTQLSQLWSFRADGASPANAIAASPIVANGTVYVGSWNGYEYAVDATTGTLKWRTLLGQTSSSATHCVPVGGSFGVTSAATVQNGVVYVGGGDANWYALDASTGAISWTVPTGDNSQNGGHYNWASPMIYGGYAYIGISSLCDKPLVQGELLKVDLSTHQIVATFDAVPNGQIGGGIWSTPSIDPATNTIYVSTGTQDGPNPNASTQPYALAMVALDATTLAVKSSWQVPQSELTTDSDWSTTPTLFSDGSGTPLVAAFNKGGYLFAFNRGNVGAGPVWQRLIAVPGACPTCGDGSISSLAVGANALFMGGNNTIINGAPCQGSVRALDPATGSILWEHCAPGVMVSSPVYANGFVVDGAGKYVEVLDAATGARLYSYTTANAGAVYSLSIANGVIYAGATDGNLYALGLPATPPPTPTPPADANCPSGWLCQDIGGPAPAGSETVSGATYTVNGGGANITGSSDQFRFVARGVSGDTQVSAQIAAQTNTNPQAKAGLMLRQSSDPAAPYYAALLTPGNGLMVQYRNGPGYGTTIATTNQGSASTPLYVEIQRQGDNFATAVSSDGVNYTLVPGSQASVVMPTSALAGLAVTSDNTGALSSAAFTSVAIGALGAPPATATPLADAACPAGWGCQDIGNFVPAGSESLSGGAWTVQGGGQDIGGAADQFRYVWQSFSGPGSVSTRVTAQSGANNQAKAGVMIRASADPAAPYFGAFVMPGNGLIVQYRLGQNYYNRVASAAPGTPPLYLRVNESINNAIYTLTADSSADGHTWSHIVGSTVYVPVSVMGSTVLGGLAVTAHSTTGALSQAQFDNVTFSGSIIPPAPTNTPVATSTSTPTTAPQPTTPPAPSATPVPTGTPVPASTPAPASTPVPASPTPVPTSAPAPIIVPPVTAPAPTSQPSQPAVTPTPHAGTPHSGTPRHGRPKAPRGPLAGTHSGSIAAIGGASSYTFTPAAGGQATVGSCAIASGASLALYVYDSDHVLVGKGVAASTCEWASLRVRAGRTYTVSSAALHGHGLYRSAWSVQGASVVWNPRGATGASGGSQTFSVPALRSGALSLSVCAPAGARIALHLINASGVTLASAAPRLHCQALSYTVPTRGLFRLWEVAHGRAGAWSGTIKTA